VTGDGVTGDGVTGDGVTAPLVSFVDDRLYDQLRTDRTEWSAVGVPLDPGETATFGAVVAEEAWLLDLGRYEDWLDLFSTECLYWVPASAGGDPQREVTLACDDRRRMGDRIAWMRTGLASAQIPPSRTTHLLSGAVRVPTMVTGEVKIRSSFVIHEARTGLAGWCGHVLVPADGRWRIARKLVQLVDAEVGWRNLTFLL
jgi:3-phenylpropionate/cinnamic acid dioxygenase small subunit